MFDDLLDGLMELPAAALDGRIREIELERRRLDAELAAAIAVAERRQLPAVDGHRTTNAYLRATLNCSNAEASRLRGLARTVDRVDGIGDRWLTGALGRSQALRFAGVLGNRRMRGRLPEFAPILLDHAEQLPFRDFSQCVERFVARADEDGAHDARDDSIEHRDAYVHHLGHAVDISASGGDGLTTAELITIHQRFTEAEYRADVDARRAEFGDSADRHPLPRTARQRRFDALVAIFRRGAAAEGLGSTSDPLVNVVIDAGTWARVLAESGLAPITTLTGRAVDPFTGLSRATELLDDLVASPEQLADVRCETSNGVALHSHDVLRAALAGHVRRVIVDAGGVVVDLGRRQRLFSGSARDAARVLFVRCEHPGCELPADLCEIDHVVEWVDGGSTHQANARVLCSSHNTDKTRRRWRSRRATDGRTYTVRADGTIMLPVGVRAPIFPDEDDAEPVDDIEHVTLLAREASIVSPCRVIGTRAAARQVAQAGSAHSANTSSLPIIEKEQRVHRPRMSIRSPSTQVAARFGAPELAASSPMA